MSRSVSHSFLPTLVWRAFLLSSTGVVGLSSSSTPSLLFDRFTPICPASENAVRNFDPSLLSEEQNETWVAVYRASNNQPTVFVRDEFLNAMRSATDTFHVTSSSSSHDPSLDEAFFVQNEGQRMDVHDTPPVAVARLYQPQDPTDDGVLVLDSMRCVLKKEATDDTCDGSEAGASEHTEALCVAIDALLEHYLQSNDRFEGRIRTKATLVSAPLLEVRGFTPVSELCRDMATHYSSLDRCLARYAERAVACTKSPAARQRAIAIVSRLGRIDRTADFEEHSRRQGNDTNDDDEDYDPWQSMRQYI